MSGLGVVLVVRMEVNAGNNADNRIGNSTVWTISIPSRNSMAACKATLMSVPKRRFLTGSQLIAPAVGARPSLGGVRGCVSAGVGNTGVAVGMVYWLCLIGCRFIFCCSVRL